MTFETLLAVPAPDGVDLGGLYAQLRPLGVTGRADTMLALFIEDGEIRIKSEEGTVPPYNLPEIEARLAAYTPTPAAEPPTAYVPTWLDRRLADYAAEIPIGDQLEAILEGGPKLEAVKAKYAAIKKRHPKPTP